MNVKIKRAILMLILLLSASIFFKQGFTQLLKGRQYEMDKLERCEKSKESFLSSVVHSIKEKPVGLVKGIVHSENKPSTVISSNNSVVYEENSIYGVTIVKIYKDKVEFAKNGKRWTQKVGGPPSSEWYK